jgi:hypothetical protein
MFNEAGVRIGTRPIFPYPRVAKYFGHGDPPEAASFVSAE